MKAFLSITFPLILIATGTNGQTGLPDPAFGVNGRSLVNFYNYNMTSEGVGKVLIQPDGKIIFAGSVSNNTGILYRFNASAPYPWQWLDGTFGNNGSVYVYGMTIDCARLQADGKIVVAGYHFNGTDNDFAVARINSNGTMDMSFGNGGKVFTVIGSGNEAAGSVAVQPDGKIIAGGYVSGSTGSFILVRYNTDGTLDNSFDGDGIAAINYGSGFISLIQDIAIQPDGKIVAAGYNSPVLPAINYDFAIARFNSDGTPDNSFDTDGKTTTAIGSGKDQGMEMALQADGKIVVAGISNNGTNDDFALVRYNSNGTLDNSFDADGKVVTPIGAGDDAALAIEILSNGAILAAGESFNGNDRDMAFVRYTTTGALDNSFDGDGKLATTLEPDPFANANERVNSMAIQSDGKIIIAGNSFNGNNYDLLNARFSSNGVLDASFSNAISIVGGTREFANGMAVQPDGKMVLAGYANTGTGNEFALVRYLANGNIDTDFGTDGKVMTDIAVNEDVAQAVALQADGKIILAGYSRAISGRTDFAVARYLANGTPDNGFDTDGKLVTSFGSDNDGARAVVVQPDGKIIVAGYGHNGTNIDFALIRYLPDGTPDPSFGTAGKVMTNITTLSEQINAIALQADGKIIAVGSAQGDFALVRYMPDGSPDPGFGIGGIVLTSIGSSTDEAMAVTIQPDGYILVAGNSFTGGSSAFAVARYKPDGNIDTDFGVNGKVTTMPGITTNSVTSISLQNDLKILVGGTANTGNNTDIAVVRYLPDGTPDANFNGDGVAVIDVLGLNDVAGAMKLYGNRIFIAGTAYSHQLEDFMLLSLQNDAFALPLSLQRFRAQVIQEDVLLQWRTVTEQNTALFYIERSQDGQAFQSIGNVTAAGTSTAVKDYSFTDTDPFTGTSYYRLKMVDIDGRFTYSAVITIRLNNNGLAALQLSPNPARNVLQVQLATTTNDKVSLQIVDVAGRVVKTEQYAAAGNSLTVSIDITGLPAGHYTLLASSKGVRETRQFIKNQ